jgi:mRNA-degrading endonuclease toxin of MazEF toxin-antitoxin module
MDDGLDRPSVVNCDARHTITRASLTTHVGSVADDTMERICEAVGYTLGC